MSGKIKEGNEFKAMILADLVHEYIPIIRAYEFALDEAARRVKDDGGLESALCGIANGLEIVAQGLENIDTDMREPDPIPEWEARG